MYEDMNQSMIKKIEQVNDKSEVMLSYSHDSITRDIKTLPQKKTSWTINSQPKNTSAIC